MIPRVVKYHNTAKRCDRKYLVKGRTNPKPQVFTHGARAMKTISVTHNKSMHTQVIIHDGGSNNHTDVLDTGSQQSIIWMIRWEIFKHHVSWIDDPHGADIVLGSRKPPLIQPYTP